VLVAGISVTPEPGAFVVAVHDTRRGIASNDLPTIFERFYRSDKARSRLPGRVGSGVAIVQAIVRAHGATIQSAAEPGVGSNFRARLPAASRA
jgi:two-component system sensor histidine kinase BaeS